eukprot:Polyplicarium_translucidae@DN2721_c3_g4_i1.p2
MVINPFQHQEIAYALGIRSAFKTAPDDGKALLADNKSFVATDPSSCLARPVSPDVRTATSQRRRLCDLDRRPVSMPASSGLLPCIVPLSRESRTITLGQLDPPPDNALPQREDVSHDRGIVCQVWDTTPLTTDGS